jgi:ribosomal protein S18 acetylase RimI-like enzyme
MMVRTAVMDDVEPVCLMDRLTIGTGERRGFLEKSIMAGECFVCVEEGIPAGFATFDNSFYGYGFISLLIVHPEHRRRGAGTQLVRHIESICPTHKLFTSTNESNTIMQRLCEKLGFIRSGRIENLDEGDPEIIYFKRISRS